MSEAQLIPSGSTNVPQVISATQVKALQVQSQATVAELEAQSKAEVARIEANSKAEIAKIEAASKAEISKQEAYTSKWKIYIGGLILGVVCFLCWIAIQNKVEATIISTLCTILSTGMGLLLAQAVSKK